EQKITITASTGLSKDEAERMKKEADSHSAEDKARLGEVEARNRLDNLVYQTEKLIKENREKLAEPDVKATEEAIEESRRALSEGGLDKLNAAAETLTKASHRIAESLYKAQQSTPGATPGGAPGQTGNGATGSADQAPGQSDVVDAEFVDVDESKKPN
ncbi:MAG: Hsp70 family protein, partial [Terracidiphilus sp.]